MNNVIVEKEKGIGIVRLNRPESLNAFSPEMTTEFSDMLRELENDAMVRVIIITGNGKSFSAGGDINKDLVPLRMMGPSQFHKYIAEGMFMYKSMLTMEKPLIAAINGYAVGLGMEVCLCCDIRVMAENAKMGEFFVKMGLITEVGNYLLPRLIGLGKAKILAFTGELIDAREAERIGLVDKVVPADVLLQSAKELAYKLAQGPKSIRYIKKAMNESLQLNLDASLNLTNDLFYKAVHTEDHEEAINAWLEKRNPKFKGR